MKVPMDIRRIPSRFWLLVNSRKIVIPTVIIVVLAFLIPIYLKQKIMKEFRVKCPACEFQIYDFSIHPFKSAVSLSFSLASDPSGVPVVKISSGQVRVEFHFIKFLYGQLDVTRIQLTDFKIIVEEKYNPKPPIAKQEDFDVLESSYAGKWMESLPLLRIENISLRNAKLDYVMKIFGKEAYLKVSEIDADISSFATRPSVGPRFTDIKLKGKLQESGLLNFRLRADLFSVANEDELEIDIQNQKMSELNSYFTNTDGIEMGGVITQIHTLVKLRQGQLSGGLWAHYKNLALHMIPTPNRGEIASSIANIGEKLTVAKTKPMAGKPPPQAAVSYKRRPGQSVIQFILAGLSEAVFKVIAN